MVTETNTRGNDTDSGLEFDSLNPFPSTPANAAFAHREALAMDFSVCAVPVPDGMGPQSRGTMSPCFVVGIRGIITGSP